MVGVLLMGVAMAESWCASPVMAHEWGVHALRADGQPAEGEPLPTWFHRTPAGAVATSSPVRQLPPDSGIRALPVVQFFDPRLWGDVPLGLEVGFAGGEATVWFPQVDRVVPAERAHGALAGAARRNLVVQRQALDPGFRTDFGGRDLGADPTKQLHWEALSLQHEPTPGLQPAQLAWVDALRQVPEALWVRRGEEAERFVFYEADTHEPPAVVVERGSTWAEDRPHYVLRNRSDHPVHDVAIVADGRSWRAPSIPAGATAGFLLEEPLDAADLRAWWARRWTDSEGPLQRDDVRWDHDDCVMMRDPAVPVEVASGHRLYEAEVEVLLQVWSARLLASDGVHLVYREDPAALDAAMPVSLYTDMFHHLTWRRLGVVLVEGVSLP